jgi:hypothetical protein
MLKQYLDDNFERLDTLLIVPGGAKIGSLLLHPVDPSDTFICPFTINSGSKLFHPVLNRQILHFLHGPFLKVIKLIEPVLDLRIGGAGSGWWRCCDYIKSILR